MNQTESYAVLSVPAVKAACTRKLLRLLLDRCIVRLINELAGDRSFTIATSNDKRSRLQHLKNGIPHGSALVHLLLNLYISDLPTTVSRKYAYVNDLAIMHADGD